MPLLVESGVFFSFICLGSRFFGVFFAPLSEEEILDYIAHRSLGRVNMSIVKPEDERKRKLPMPSLPCFYKRKIDSRTR